MFKFGFFVLGVLLFVFAPISQEVIAQELPSDCQPMYNRVTGWQLDGRVEFFRNTDSYGSECIGQGSFILTPQTGRIESLDPTGASELMVSTQYGRYFTDWFDLFHELNGVVSPAPYDPDSAHSVHYYDLDTLLMRRSSPGFALDGRRVSTTQFELVDLPDMTTRVGIPLPPGYVSVGEPHISPDGQSIGFMATRNYSVGYSYDACVYLFESNTNRCLIDWHLRIADWWDNENLIVLHNNGQMLSWNVAQIEVSEFMPEIENANDVSFSADRRALAFSEGSSIYLTDMTSGELQLVGEGYNPLISPDGSQVAYVQWRENEFVEDVYISSVGSVNCLTCELSDETFENAPHAFS